MANDPTSSEPSLIRDARSSRLGLVAGLLLVLASVSGLWAITDLRQSTLTIDREKATIIGLERLLSALKDLETGQRGYLLTGDESYLDPYNRALPRLDGDLHALEDAPIDIGSLKRIVGERTASARIAVDTFRADGLDAVRARLRAGTGKAAMDAVRPVRGRRPDGGRRPHRPAA